MKGYLRLLLVSPYWRSGIPIFSSLIIGWFSNVLCALSVNNGEIYWHVVATSWITRIIVLLSIGTVFYQVAVFRSDQKVMTAQDQAVEKTAAALADFYDAEIRAGRFDNLIKMRQLISADEFLKNSLKGSK